MKTPPPERQHRLTRHRWLPARFVQASVVRGAVVAEKLRVTDVPGFAMWVEHGVVLEQSGQRLLGGRSLVEAPKWHEDGDGPAVVLLNGWTLSGSVWPAAVVEQLASEFRVIRIDNRGTGQRRGAATPFTMADLADDVAAVIEAAGVRQPTVVGFSLGGMIGIELALRHPNLVGSLVVMSSRPPNPAQRMGSRSVATAFEAPRSDRPFDAQLIERWGAVAGPGFAQAYPERLAEMAASALQARTPWRTVLAQARAVMGWHRPERLRNLAVPTLIVHGAADPLSPPDNGRMLAKLVPDARLVALDGVGHLVPQEAPETIAALINRHAMTAQSLTTFPRNQPTECP